MRTRPMGIGAWILMCVLAGSALGQNGPTPLTTIRVASGLDSPVYVTHAPGDYERLFIVEKTGRIKILRRGSVLATPFLNVDPISMASGERGLLGLAFHPDYATNGYFFINYTDNLGDTVVARYHVSADPDIADEASATPVLMFDQPLSFHNGGWIDFGPDGYLYIPTGDGGRSFNAQRIDGILLGKILRIDVDGNDFPEDATRNYAIPPDNPFVGEFGADEIWSYGLRNPWRCAFDSVTGDMYIADVGQDTWEELDFQAAGTGAGRNYGWDCMEASSCFGIAACECNEPSLTLPIHEYTHGGSPFRCSITGGEVYRGCAIPDLDGAYFFADFCSGQIWSLRVLGGVATELTDRTAELGPPGGQSISNISSFGRDAAGEVYICGLGGSVFKIVPTTAPPVQVMLRANPPDASIDAGQPFEPDGTSPSGWSSLMVTLSECAEGVRAGGFTLSQVGGSNPPPTINGVTRVGERVVRLALSGPIARQTRTTVLHVASGVTTSLAWLPADVNGDGVSEAFDLAVLANHLAGVIDPLPDWSTDIDRSGATVPADLLREIDLLLGAGQFLDYAGRTLP